MADSYYNKISYNIIEPKDDIRTELSNALNLQLNYDDDIPFVPFDDLANLQSANKIFLYGRHGCGKSRAILEILDEAKYERVYVMNKSVDEQSLHDYYSLTTLDDTDAIVWDNFPDGLIHKDINEVKKVLYIIAGNNADVFITLKPTYLELYKNITAKIPEITSKEVSYNVSNIATIIEAYGSLSTFQDVYNNYVNESLDEIAYILYNKEPTPLFVMRYLEELVKVYQYSLNIDAVKIAKESSISSTNYYKNQFSLLVGMDDRQDDIDFIH